jgi:ABC-type proline/glycine betaine transport system permease subunit
MRISSFDFLQLNSTTSFFNSTPGLDAMLQAWDHIAERYISRITDDKKLASRVRSIRLLAVHDAVTSILEPTSGLIFKEQVATASVDAALAAAAQASYDILAEVSLSLIDQVDLHELLQESLELVPDQTQVSAGVSIGLGSATAYLTTFSHLLKREVRSKPRPSVAAAQRSYASLFSPVRSYSNGLAGVA